MGVLARIAKKDPGNLQRRRQREVNLIEKKDAIEETAARMLATNIAIVRAQQVKEAVKEATDLEVDRRLVCRVMRKEMRLGYRLAKTVPV